MLRSKAFHCVALAHITRTPPCSLLELHTTTTLDPTPQKNIGSETPFWTTGAGVWVCFILILPLTHSPKPTHCKCACRTHFDVSRLKRVNYACSVGFAWSSLFYHRVSRSFGMGLYSRTL